MIRVKPIVNGWALIENTRTSVIYKAPELALSIFLTKTHKVWNIKYFHNNKIIDEDESPIKENAVAMAKGFMHRNPVPLDTVPFFEPGEEIPPLRATKFKNPKRVTQFSRHRR